MTDTKQTTDGSRPPDGAVGTAQPRDLSSAVVAIALWIVVLAALIYGITASASKVVALFGA